MGGGTLTLNAANTYGGPTPIQNGTVLVASLNSVVGGTSSSNLGTPLTVAAGTISLGGGGIDRPTHLHRRR